MFALIRALVPIISRNGPVPIGARYFSKIRAMGDSFITLALTALSKPDAFNPTLAIDRSGYFVAGGTFIR